MNLRKLIPLLALCGACVWAQQPAATGLVDAARGRVAIPDPTNPPPLTNSVNDDHRRPRNYDMQPPTIPHRVDGYQIDKNFNKCMDCHARDKSAFSLAIPVSATHYIDRDGKALQQISTRRYFCLQCHFAQEPVQPIVDNGFENVDTLAKKAAAASQAARK
ncbi:nitrate reductase cytochrome c-type subunit [Variovorax rhizosphaerae]|uniref:Periplasmic nitrate reductase, electron transfer subunit n=1 Tax=Variovorax rhizosphaerae TaxID=1836200 RepID=A0ABU8WEJ0_9BURK